MAHSSPQRLTLFFLAASSMFGVPVMMLGQHIIHALVGAQTDVQAADPMPHAQDDLAEIGAAEACTAGDIAG